MEQKNNVISKLAQLGIGVFLSVSGFTLSRAGNELGQDITSAGIEISKSAISELSLNTITEKFADKKQHEYNVLLENATKKVAKVWEDASKDNIEIIAEIQEIISNSIGKIELKLSDISYLKRLNRSDDVFFKALAIELTNKIQDPKYKNIIIDIFENSLKEIILEDIILSSEIIHEGIFELLKTTKNIEERFKEIEVLIKKDQPTITTNQFIALCETFGVDINTPKDLIYGELVKRAEKLKSLEQSQKEQTENNNLSDILNELKTKINISIGNGEFKTAEKLLLEEYEIICKDNKSSDELKSKNIIARADLKEITGEYFLSYELYSLAATFFESNNFDEWLDLKHVSLVNLHFYSRHKDNSKFPIIISECKIIIDKILTLKSNTSKCCYFYNLIGDSRYEYAKIDVNSSINHIFEGRRSYESAIKYWNKSVSISIKSNSYLGLGNFDQLDIGVIFEEEHKTRLKAAIKSYRIAATLSSTSSNNYGLFVINCNLVAALRKLGQYGNIALFDEAIEIISKTLPNVDLYIFEELWANLHNNYALILISKSKFQHNQQIKSNLLNEALTHLFETFKIRKVEKLPYEWALTQMNIARVYLEILKLEIESNKSEIVFSITQYLNNAIYIYKDNIGVIYIECQYILFKALVYAIDNSITIEKENFACQDFRILITYPINDYFDYYLNNCEKVDKFIN